MQLSLYIPYAINHEKQLGTIRYLLFFILSNAGLHIAYTLILFIIGLFASGAQNAYSCGLFPITLTEAYISAYRNPDKLTPYF